MGPFNGYFVVHFACESARIKEEQVVPVTNSEGQVNPDEHGFAEMQVRVSPESLHPVRETTARILVPESQIESMAAAFQQAAEDYRNNKMTSGTSK
ncbi:hypothetical protein SAJA_08335 [Salinisphaera japonica YTM-1]|uniref:Uncharacterized protein n=2 Tax=Salinisphaera TaxID=180541 RepID=A0A423PRA7_9GAMM|nr:hypothetical protein SAJA_08335 [Salinisphaera japonica YTM-1]